LRQSRLRDARVSILPKNYLTELSAYILFNYRHITFRAVAPREEEREREKERRSRSAFSLSLINQISLRSSRFLMTVGNQPEFATRATRIILSYIRVTSAEDPFEGESSPQLQARNIMWKSDCRAFCFLFINRCTDPRCI